MLSTCNSLHDSIINWTPVINLLPSDTETDDAVRADAI